MKKRRIIFAIAVIVDLSEPLWQLKQQMLDSYFGAASN